MRAQGGSPLKIPTVRERIQLHLFDYDRFRDEYESPPEVTQGGIADAVGIKVPHIPQNVRPLLTDEILEERTSHIKKGGRRRKVYFLTPLGRNRAASLRSALLHEEVPYRSRSGETQAIPLSEIYQNYRRGTNLCQLLLELKSLTYVPEEGGEEEPGIVDFSREAPKVESFYGRDEEVAQTLGAVEEVPLVVVTGMAGIGKTALGSKVCEALRGQRSLFWREIRAFDGALDLALRLGHFLNSMGRLAVHSALLTSGPKALGQIEELLQEDLAGVEALLVFDDVQKASEDAMSFLGLLHRVLKQQHGTSALLLSREGPPFYSRREVSVERSVVELPLGRLGVESSEAILLEAGVPKALIGPFIKAAGGNPLFLRLLSKATVRGVPKVQTLEVYIAEEIEPRLSAPELRCLEAASLYEVPVPPSGLLLEKGVRTRVLVSLGKKGLLERVDPDRLVLHDTLRSYFGKGVSRERTEEITEKVIPWLRKTAEELAEGGSPEEGLVFVQNAVAIDAQPSRLGSSLELLARLRKFVGDYPGAIEAYRMALRLAEDTEVQARLHRKIALAQARLGNLEEAETEIDVGLALLPAEPSQEAAWLHFQRGNIAYSREEFEPCRRTVELVLGWYRHLPEDLNLYGALVNLRALVYLDDQSHHDPSLAQADLKDAERAFKKTGNHRMLSNVYNNMGIVAIEQGRGEEAFAYLDRAVAVAEEAGDFVMQASPLLTKGFALMDVAGDYEAAETTYKESYTRHKATHQGERLMWHYWHFAELYRRQGRYEEARESLEYYIQARGTGTSRQARARDLGFMIRLCVLCGDPAAAEGYFDEAWKLVEEVHSEEAEAAITWAKGTLLASKGDTKGADESFQRAADKADVHLRGEVLLEYGRFLNTEGRAEEAREAFLQAREALKHTSRGSLKRSAREELETLRIST